MLIPYDPSSTMREARRTYFEANGFGPNGGYDDAWVDFKLGSIPFPFPNTPARIRAVRYHDLHHVLTGYDTDVAGELEISAWEIAAGCKGFAAAWVLNLSGLAAGALTKPSRTFAAWVRGRRSKTLYAEDFEPLLGATVGELRAKTTADTASRATLADVVTFALAAIVGLVLALALLALLMPLVPVGLLSARLRRPAPKAT